MFLGSKRSKGPLGRERSPFSSPNSNLHASPIAARRSSLEERRRPAAKYEHGTLPGPTDRIEEEYHEEDDDEEEDPDDIGEDEAGELSPLLPIFSAAQLGT
jgi:hypothetical protein